MAKKAKTQAEIDINAIHDGEPGDPGQTGAQGYTFRPRGVHIPNPSVAYRWDAEYRDVVYHYINDSVAAYELARNGTVPSGTAITNTSWWRRNDEHLQFVSANNIMGDLSAFKVRSVATVVDSQAKYDNLCRALSGGSNTSYNWDLETNVIIVSTYASRTFLPHPSSFRNKSLKIIRWPGWSNYIPSSYRGYFYIYQKTTGESIPMYATGDSTGTSFSSDYSSFYKMTISLNNNDGPEAVLTNLDLGGTAIYEFFSDGAKWYWQNSREFSTAFREVVSPEEKVELKAAADWVNRVSTAKKSPRLAALVIEGTYTNSNTYTINGQFGYIEWEGSSPRNGISLASNLPVGFTCEVQNNSTLYDLSISGTIMTNISVVPKRTIVRIRKNSQGLIVTIVASLNATVTSKI